MESLSKLSGIISFVHAARLGSFTAAARLIDVTPAAVSKNVAALETSLGVRLMNRTTRSLSLTAEGTLFLSQAQLALESLEQAVESLTTAKSNPVGLVRMSVPNVIGRRLLMPVLPDLLALHPGLNVELDFDDRLVDFVQEGYDLVVRGGTIHDSSMISRSLGPLKLGLVATPEYLKKFGVPKQPGDLSKHKLISRRFLGSKLSPWTFHQPDGKVFLFEPRSTAITLSDPEAMIQAALSGLGIAEVGIYLAWEHLQSGALKLILHDSHDPGAFELMLQYPHRALLAPRVRATADFLLEVLRNHEGLRVNSEQLKRYAV
ncbi:MAG: LysR family transcriptional regulator [Gammaproteobacteria bacterium]|nr:LysR family transcriptional regulator [Gammaproteobacteria bacterium]